MNSTGKKSGFTGLTEPLVLGMLGIMALFVLLNLFKGPPETDAAKRGPNASKLSAQSVIFINTDSLNMRSAPHLDSMVVKKLLLGERVLYLDQRTDFRQKINMGTVLMNEPWVLVKSHDGIQGWIYGGGAQYYSLD